MLAIMALELLGLRAAACGKVRGSLSEPPPALRIEYAEVSLLGCRADNQDRVSVAVSEHSALLVVIDGMGGHSDGARAAETALKVLVEAFWHTPQPILDPLGFLHLTLGRAHEEVAKLGVNLPLEQRPRATCAVCLVQNGSALWAHIGDSRVYLLRRGKVFKRTRDHSHVEFLLREGVITADQALTHPMRNFVECCLGGEPYPARDDTRPARAARGQRHVCSSARTACGAASTTTRSAAAFPPARAPLREELQRLAERSVSIVGAGSDNTTAAAVRWIGNCLSTRPSGRAPDELRAVRFTRRFTQHAEGSVLVEFGDTRVLVHGERRGGRAWIPARQGPGLGDGGIRHVAARDAHAQSPREAAKGKQSGRTQEIQRLIGRSLRAVIDLARARRTHDHASIATCCRPMAARARPRSPAATSRSPMPAMRWSPRRAIAASPLHGQVAAVSVGHLQMACRCSISTTPRIPAPRPT